MEIAGAQHGHRKAIAGFENALKREGSEATGR
jgi:hypothetical protein